MAKTAQEKADAKAEKLYKKTHKQKYKLSPGDILFEVLNYLIFTLFTLACIFPFIICLSIRSVIMTWF